MIQIGFREILLSSQMYPQEMYKKNDHKKIEIKNLNAENQSFIFTNLTENTNTSLEASLVENIDTIVHSRTMDSNLNANIELNLIPHC